tara:strand:+ start:2617 stop:3327 length:711 start_codon:yes stop_codon:yes gene_type:complete
MIYILIIHNFTFIADPSSIMKRLLLFTFFFILQNITGQNNLEIGEDYIRITGDTIIKGSIQLSEVILLPKAPYSNSDEIRNYLILKRKVLKVYPYAVLASHRLDSLNKRLNRLDTRYKKKKYTKQIQKYLENEFTVELKSLKQSEGRVLIKLVDRQTGLSTYDIVKDLRNGIKAFFYNITASFFNLNLKDRFNPVENIQDYYIEDIIQRSINNKQIDYHKPKKKYDLYNLKEKWVK